MRSSGSGSPGVVDDIADLTLVVEGDRDHVVETYAGIDGNLNSSREYHVGMAEDAVDAESPGFVAGNGIGDFVGSPTVSVGSARVAGLVGWVIWNFRLIEVGSAGIAIP